MGETEYQEALKLGKKNISPVCIADVFHIFRFWMIFFQERISGQNRIWD